MRRFHIFYFFTSINKKNHKNMKNFKVFVAVAICAATVCVNAQNTVTRAISLDENGKAELKSFFVQHPTDTILTKLNGQTVKLYLKGGNVCYDIVATATPKATAPATTTSTTTVKTTAKVEKVEKTENDGRDVTFKSGSQMSLERKAVNDISTEEGVEILNGQRAAVDPEHKDYSGVSLHRLQFALLGGANYYGCFSPQVTARVGYETCHWIFQVDGIVSRSELGETAKYAGAHYTNLTIQGNLGYKVWQSLKLDNYLAVVAHLGYGYQETDNKDDEDYNRSSNYGLVVGLGLQGAVALSSRFALGIEAGWKLYPSVDHGVDEVQKFSNQGAYAQVGLMFRIP
jgi:hypothetical protein